MIFTLQSHQIADHWNEIEPLVSALDEWVPEEIKAQLESEHAQLWGLKDDRIRAVVITKLKLPLGIIWIASGKGVDDEAMTLLGAIEAWMKERGVSEVRFEGRRGWGKVLPGYVERFTVFAKRL